MVVTPGSAGLSSVVKEFGQDILASDGSLNRRILGQLVFHDKERLHKLQSILHPLIRSEVERQRKVLEQQGFPLAIYDIPLLFETHSENQFDLIVVVSSTLEQQRHRMAVRDYLASKEIDDRLAAQLPMEIKEKEADFIVRNDKDFMHLNAEIQRLIDWLKRESAL
jgi:dephospho-CoA kinase